MKITFAQSWLTLIGFALLLAAWNYYTTVFGSGYAPLQAGLLAIDGALAGFGFAKYLEVKRIHLAHITVYSSER